MAESNKHSFTLEEIAQALMVKQGIHKGFWSLSVEFKFAALVAGPSPKDFLPSAIAGVSGIGLNKADKETPLSFDATVLNPKASTVKKATPRSKIKKVAS